MHTEKGPERNYRCRARYCRCLSGRTINTCFHNARPAHPAPCGITRMEKYFPRAGEVVLTATTPRVAKLPLHATALPAAAVWIALPASGGELILITSLLPTRRLVALSAALAFPMASRPDVLAVLPAPISRCPQVAGPRRRHFFDLQGWRTNPHNDPRFSECRQRRRAHAQRQAQHGAAQGVVQLAAARRLQRARGPSRRWCIPVSNSCSFHQVSLQKIDRNRPPAAEKKKARNGSAVTGPALQVFNGEDVKHSVA